MIDLVVEPCQELFDLLRFNSLHSFLSRVLLRRLLELFPWLLLLLLPGRLGLGLWVLLLKLGLPCWKFTLLCVGRLTRILACILLHCSEWLLLLVSLVGLAHHQQLQLLELFLICCDFGVLEGLLARGVRVWRLQLIEQNLALVLVRVWFNIIRFWFLFVRHLYELLRVLDNRGVRQSWLLRVLIVYFLWIFVENYAGWAWAALFVVIAAVVASQVGDEARHNYFILLAKCLARSFAALIRGRLVLRGVTVRVLWHLRLGFEHLCSLDRHDHSGARAVASLIERLSYFAACFLSTRDLANLFHLWIQDGLQRLLGIWKVSDVSCLYLEELVRGMAACGYFLAIVGLVRNFDGLLLAVRRAQFGHRGDARVRFLMWDKRRRYRVYVWIVAHNLDPSWVLDFVRGANFDDTWCVLLMMGVLLLDYYVGGGSWCPGGGLSTDCVHLLAALLGDGAGHCPRAKALLSVARHGIAGGLLGQLRGDRLRVGPTAA